MNWDAVSALSQVAGLFAIVASLIYIGAQTKQSNDHATAASETSWLESLNELTNSWVDNDRVISALRKGFGSFDALDSSEKAIFQMRIGGLVNHWLLAKQLSSKGLLDQSISDVITEVVLSILATPGGLEYWEYDSKATPDGLQLLEMAKEWSASGKPTFIDLMPWWGSITVARNSDNQ